MLSPCTEPNIFDLFLGEKKEAEGVDDEEESVFGLKEKRAQVIHKKHEKLKRSHHNIHDVGAPTLHQHCTEPQPFFC